MNRPCFYITIFLLLGIFGCNKENIETDECDTDPTSCGCSQAPPNCDGSSGALSGIVYVSPSGNDSNDGSENKPFKTIQKAADEADPSKALEIVLRGGTHESKEIKFRTSNIYLHSYPGEWAVIKASTTVEDITSCLWFREPTTENITH